MRFLKSDVAKAIYEIDTAKGSTVTRSRQYIDEVCKALRENSDSDYIESVRRAMGDKLIFDELRFKAKPMMYGETVSRNIHSLLNTIKRKGHVKRSNLPKSRIEAVNGYVARGLVLRRMNSFGCVTYSISPLGDYYCKMPLEEFVDLNRRNAIQYHEQ